MVTGGQPNLAAVGILGYLAWMETTPAEHDFDAASAQGVFGPYLRGLRLAARLSQRELADRSGVSARTISDLERGVWRTPRADSAAMLAVALDLDAPRSPSGTASFAPSALPAGGAPSRSPRSPTPVSPSWAETGRWNRSSRRSNVLAVASSP